MAIYWDHNATSPLHPQVKARMKEALDFFLANPQSMHSAGQEARSQIESARQTLAQSFGVKPSEIIFTSSATEANLLALWGLFHARQRRVILASPLEHASVHENLLFLQQKFGAEIRWMPLTSQGLIDLPQLADDLKKSSASEISFAVVMGAHNETGVLQPWQELAAILKPFEIPLHCDLVQAVGRISLPALRTETALATATLSFHKAGGPKGVAILWQREGVVLDSLIGGGGQEKKRRAGTENALAILGAAALMSEIKPLIEKMRDIEGLRNLFESEVLRLTPGSLVVGQSLRRLPQTSTLIMPRGRSDMWLASLDLRGIAASSGAACSSGMILPSRSLLALGFTEAEAQRALRFSLGGDSCREEVDTVASALALIDQRFSQVDNPRNSRQSGQECLTPSMT